MGRVLSECYGLTDDGVDFAINWDVKYHMDRGSDVNVRRVRQRLRAERKNEVKKELKGVNEEVRRRGTCLYVIDEKGQRCGNPVNNNCHVIPKSSVLGKLEDNHNSRKVLELQWGVAQWAHFFVSSSESDPIDLDDIDKFEPRPVVTGDACVRWFACKDEDNGTDHDGEFSPIDVADPDFSDPTVRLLSMYRASLYTADLYRLGERLTEDKSRARQVWGHPNREVSIKWESLRTAVKNGITKAEAKATQLGKMWHRWKTYRRLDADAVSADSMVFRSRLRFAACVIYESGAVAMVFPIEGDKHKMGILHMSEDADSVSEGKARLLRMAQESVDSCDYGVSVIEKLMANGGGVVAASPESYHALADDDRRTIRKIVRHHSSAETMKMPIRHQPPQPRGWRGMR